MLEIKTNVEAVVETLDQLSKRLKSQLPALLEQLGVALREDVKQRIKSGDDGTWHQPSKWTMAKKGVVKSLVGAENYVFYRVTSGKLTIFAKTPGEWTLTQHEQGFQNKLAREDEKVGEHVRLRIVNPAPLGLKKPGDFYFVPKRAGVTPPRKIWTTPERALKIATPIAFRWLKKVASETRGVKP